MRVGAFVMTFDRPVQLGRTLRALLAQTRPPDHVLVIDNGSAPGTPDTVRDLGDSRIEYHSMSGNTGPAGAAAFGLATLAAQSYDWIYWGDDDDAPRTVDTLARLIAIAEVCPTDVAVIAAFGQEWDWTKGRVKRLADQRLAGLVEVDVVAGNGQVLVSASATRQVGIPTPTLFFGLEEIEFSLRLRRAGYRLLVAGDLMQEYRRQAGRLGPITRPLVIFRPPGATWRDYYSTRNYIHMMSSTFARPDLARRQAVRALGRCVLSWSRGPRYAWPYCVFTLRGVIDGFRGRLGCQVEPKHKYSPLMSARRATASAQSPDTTAARRPDRAVGLHLP